MTIELLNMIETVSRGVDKLKPLVLDFIKDKNIPLDERWEFFGKIPDYFLEKDCWVMHYELDGEEISWYDDHYIDKYATADNLRIVETYENNMAKGSYGYDPKITKEILDNLKEQMLQSGVRYWVNDW